MAKRSLCMLLAVATVFSLAAPALAGEAPVEEPIVTEEPVVEATEEPVVEAAEEPAPEDEPIPVEAAEEPVEEPEITEAPEEAEEPEEPGIVADTATSGNCGPWDNDISGFSANVQWSFSGGTLTVSGNGPMDDFVGNIPWRAYTEQIVNVVIQEGVTSIGSDAFWGSTMLASISIPTSMESIGEDAFAGCSNLTSIAIPGKVTSIGEGAFINCGKLTSVKLNTGLTTIGSSAFNGCSSLTSIVLPSGLLSISDSLFEKCSRLASVTIPDTVTSIGAKAFNCCYALTSVSIPSSVISIGDSAFLYCSALTSVIIPQSVTSIGGHTFSYCENLTAVSIPGSVTSIGNDAFSECSNLTAVSIPGSVASVGSYAFMGCSKLASVVLSEGIITLGEDAFADCTSLQTVTIPASLTSIGTRAFGKFSYGCTAMTAINVAAGNPVYSSVNGALLNAAGTTLITVPQGMTGTFIIPNGVTVIDDEAFMGCSRLAGVDIPESIPSLANYLFYDCSLQSLIVRNPNCQINIPLKYNAVIYGIAGSTAEAYANAHGMAFKTLEELNATPTPAPTPTPVPVTPTPEPTATPKPTETPKPTAAPKPTATPAPAKLATPKITKMENTASGLKVTWNKVKGADRYTVFYKLKGASKWTKIGTTTATSYTRKAKDLKSGKTYVFTIRCVKNDKKTYTSDYDKAGKSLTYYAAPTVKIAKASNGGIKVTWNKVAGASRYMVYYKENGGSWKRIGTTTATSYTRAASKLKNGVTYQFTVRCVKNDKKTLLSYYKASNSLKYKK